ncbi:BrnA antitoxin family protein [Brevundimonas sp. UBA7534]|uniref:BrnA antitoxin family protein n=1 Tax=Brevundimonas sp. UBA7534 TaxID=1946138 RepID=UPI0025C25A4C|nr:BrnA antitoxin family protein [Brevundimonas sp. UBA7534]
MPRKIDLTDPENPEWTEADFVRGQAASTLPAAVIDAFPRTARRVRGAQKAPTKTPVSLRLDADVVAYFKATGPGWQTRINDVLSKVARS